MSLDSKTIQKIGRNTWLYVLMRDVVWYLLPLAFSFKSWNQEATTARPVWYQPLTP